MYTLSRDFEFCYGHRLARHPGRCRRLHGHNAVVRLVIKQESLGDDGMVVDFGKLKETAGEWIETTLDHRTILEVTDPLAVLLQQNGEACVLLEFPPTAENLARFVFEGLLREGLPVYSVTLWETPRCSATYTAQNNSVNVS